MSARQEVLNTELARLLCQQGLVALPEQRLNTNRAVKDHKFLRVQNPPTPFLPSP